ncbi:peptidoglycan-recognition protein SC2-like isoform X2 [Danaus plexippus]|uniref:peptidoglycan-recognition protein SC2-like isoform X2 n=1 Tax=Danaus plexippus TaxID=13037 RepID=UPI002AAF9E6E|nr:peptidoglycan-recognition protein SC2-like isoform X2 [Danaus plexippus]
MWRSREDTGQTVAQSRVPAELSVIDESAIASAIPSPAVANLNISKSSKVHIGPKFVSVTQNVQNAETLKGRFLGLELVSTKQARRLRCSVAVFVCWALVVASALVIYLVYVALPNQQFRLDIGLNETWYLRRGDWQAMNPYNVRFLHLPVPKVIIGHSAANYCNQRYRCIEQMIIIQQDHLRRELSDIGPNFLVGGNGFVFEGRGANVHGAMVGSLNSRAISIMFMGNYIHDQPDSKQFEHLNVLLDVLVREGVLRQDYTLVGHCQVNFDTISPGPHIMTQLGHFLHWNRANASRCLPRQRMFEND